MSSGKKGQASNCDVVLVGQALAQPSLLGQVLEERDGGLTNGTIFVDEAVQRTLVEEAGSHVVILFKARQRSDVIARDTKRAVAKNTFGINDVAQNLLDCPFAGSIRELGGATIIDTLQQRRALLKLGGEDRQYLVAHNKIYINCRIRRVLGSIRTAKDQVAHAGSLA